MRLYIYAGIALAVLALLVGAFVAHTNYVNKVREEAKAAGIADERGRWQTRENKELVQANATITFLNDAYRKREGQWAADLNQISTNYQKELTDVRNKRDRDIAAARAGALVLRDPGAGPATPSQASGGGAPTSTPTAASGRDGQARGQLSGTASAFLLGLAGEADEVAIQLGACQKVVENDRKLVSSYQHLLLIPLLGAGSVEDMPPNLGDPAQRRSPVGLDVVGVEVGSIPHESPRLLH